MPRAGVPLRYIAFMHATETPRGGLSLVPERLRSLAGSALREGQMNFATFFSRISQARIPIITDLYSASWPNWREALKEIFVILFFLA